MNGIEIEVLTSTGCASCQKAKATVTALVEKARSQYPGLRWREVNLVDEPDVARRYGVMSTPAIAINGALWKSGVPRERELLKALEQASG